MPWHASTAALQGSVATGSCVPKIWSNQQTNSLHSCFAGCHHRSAYDTLSRCAGCTAASSAAGVACCCFEARGGTVMPAAAAENSPVTWRGNTHLTSRRPGPETLASERSCRYGNTHLPAASAPASHGTQQDRDATFCIGATRTALYVQLCAAHPEAGAATARPLWCAVILPLPVGIVQQAAGVPPPPLLPPHPPLAVRCALLIVLCSNRRRC